jgi:cell division protein FtsB
MPQYTDRKKFYRRKPKLKKHLKRLLPVIIIFGYIYYLLFGPYGFINIFRLKKEEVNLREQKEKLLEEKEALNDSINLIRNDSLFLEKLAREKLGMITPGDTVILNIE